MKLTSMLLALAGFGALTGCDSGPALLSLEPVATAQETAIDAALVGTWVEPDDKDILCVIRPDPASGYQILYLAGATPSAFQAQLFRVGDAEFLDVTPAEDDDAFRIAGHAVARVWPNGGSLRLAFLDSDWLKQQSKTLATHDAGGKMLVLSPGAAVRAWLSVQGADDRAYGKLASWERLQ